MSVLEATPMKNSSLDKAWKEDVLHFLRRSVDRSLDEQDNYDRFVSEYDCYRQGFLDDDYGYILNDEELQQLGASTKLINQFNQWEDLSDKKQDKVREEVRELVLDYSDLCMDDEEEWIRSKISKLLKTV